MQNTIPLIFKPNDEFRRQANVSGLEDYQALWEFADKDYLQYWSELARELITWKKPFMQIFDDSKGKCPIVDTWWQTETGSIMLAPVPGVIATKPGSCTLPLPGIMAEVVNDQGQKCDVEESGSLVIKRPFPSMLRTIWGDDERYKETYFPDTFGGKYYVAGDSALRDKDGYFWILGRTDDVLNVSGHRLGTAEIESALVAHERVVEAAVVGKPDEIKGESVVAFVVLNGFRPEGEEAKALAEELKIWVSNGVIDKIVAKKWLKAL